MRLFLWAAAAGYLFTAGAIAADLQKVDMQKVAGADCTQWHLSDADLKSCNDQMARAKSDADRKAVQYRFDKSATTSAGDPTATIKTTGDTRAGVLPDQKKNAPGSGSQGSADKKGTPERTP